MKIKTIGTGTLYQDRHGYLTAALHLNGRQMLKRVKSEEQAKQWILTMELERVETKSLTAVQINDAANAFFLLIRNGLADTTLTAIAEQHIKASVTRTVSLSRAVEEYLRRTKSRVTTKTLGGYTAVLQRFIADMGPETSVASLRKADVIQWLDNWEDKPATWLANQRVLSKFYNECIKMEFCQENPFAGLAKPRLPPPNRKFLSAEEARKALRSVVKRQPRYIHFLTLGLFAGIRPVESVRLTRKHINLDTGYIHIDAFTAKSHAFKERMVRINGTLRAWLTRYPFGEKPVPTSSIVTVDKVIKRCAEMDGWERTQDNLRHSFGTYEFARTGNSAETAAMMGHSERVAMLHYRGRVTKEEAERFFALVPEVCSTS